jgi:hypothetical protein
VNGYGTRPKYVPAICTAAPEISAANAANVPPYRVCSAKSMTTKIPAPPNAEASSTRS